MNTTVGDLIGELQNAIDAIMLRYQTAEGITSGDIDPLDARAIDDNIDSIAEVMMRVLTYEKDGFPYPTNN